MARPKSSSGTRTSRTSKEQAPNNGTSLSEAKVTPEKDPVASPPVSKVTLGDFAAPERATAEQKSAPAQKPEPKLAAEPIAAEPITAPEPKATPGAKATPEAKVVTEAKEEPKGSAETRKFEVMKTDSRKNVVPINLEDEIRRRAYELYQQRGHASGNEAEDWLAAEREIRQRYRQQTA